MFSQPKICLVCSDSTDLSNSKINIPRNYFKENLKKELKSFKSVGIDFIETTRMNDCLQFAYRLSNDLSAIKFDIFYKLTYVTANQSDNLSDKQTTSLKKIGGGRNMFY